MVLKRRATVILGFAPWRPLVERHHSDQGPNGALLGPDICSVYKTEFPVVAPIVY